MSMPVVDVSVVIPFYRGADTIERAVRSIAAQTRRPREIVVVKIMAPEYPKTSKIRSFSHSLLQKEEQQEPD